MTYTLCTTLDCWIEGEHQIHGAQLFDEIDKLQEQVEKLTSERDECRQLLRGSAEDKELKHGEV
jgi:hypothetical protein